MSQDNQFHQYGYDHYLKAPKKSRNKTTGFGSRIVDGLQSPLVATGALLITGVVFAGIIILAYPSQNDAPQEIPIVRADLRPVKSEPEDFGVEESHEESSVLAQIGQPRDGDVTGNVENLLAPSEEGFESKEKALEHAVSEKIPGSVDPVEQALTGNVTPTLIEEARKLETEGASAAASAMTEPSNEISEVIQKIDEAMPAAPAAAVEQTASVDDKPATFHAAATSPETIDYVRSVLNESQTESAEKQSAEEKISAAQETEVIKKSEPKAAKEVIKKEKPVKAAKLEQDQKAEKAAKISPAAGAASPNVNIKAGNYYVQLASITDRSRSAVEYTKLQKKFSALSGVKYRVQEANLDKGLFYRIQAGPMSKDSAKQVCEAIKNQNGGCIVTK